MYVCIVFTRSLFPACLVQCVYCCALLGVCVYVGCPSVPFCVSVFVCINCLCGSVTLMLCFITSSHVKCPSSWQFSVFM